MGFLGFKTDAEKKAENDAMRKRAQENADKQYAKDAAAMSGAAPTPPTPPAAPAGTMQTGAAALGGNTAQNSELQKLKAAGYKKGGVIKCATGGVISSGEKKLLKQKAMVKQKRGC